MGELWGQVTQILNIIGNQDLSVDLRISLGYNNNIKIPTFILAILKFQLFVCHVVYYYLDLPK